MDYFLRSPVMSEKGIYLISQQSLWFFFEGNLSRLCSFAGEVRHLCISPNGKFLSFVGSEDSNGDVYIYCIESGSVSRVSYFDDPMIHNISINNDQTVTISSNVNSPFSERSIYEIKRDSQVNKMKYRDAGWISTSNNKILLQRFGYGYYTWLGYRGGLAARIFYGKEDSLKELNLPKNNCCRPFFINDNIFFFTDVDGRFNLYEYDLKEEKYIQKTFHKDFSIRDCATYKDKVIYSCGGDIYQYSSISGEVKKLEIKTRDYSYQSGDFVSTSISQYVTDSAISDTGQDFVLTARGHAFSCKLWDKGFLKNSDSIRYRFIDFISKHEVLRIKDELEDSIIEKFNLDTLTVEYATRVNIGRVSSFLIKDKSYIIVENSKGELILVNMENGETEEIIRGRANKIHGFDVSNCGDWLTYSIDSDHNFSSIYLYNFKSKQHNKITYDGSAYAPAFSADCNYIFYLSDQELSTNYDSFFFNIAFKENTALCALCLNNKVGHPFRPWEQNQSEVIHNEKEDPNKTKEQEKNPNENAIKNEDSDKSTDEKTSKEKCDIRIEEIVAVKSNLANGCYSAVIPVSNTKLMVLMKEDPTSKIINLASVDLTNNQINVISSAVDLVSISKNREWMIVYSNDKFRIGRAGEQFDDTDKSYKNGGIISICNQDVKLSQKQEWKNILEDAWRLLKDHFWCGKPKNWDNVLIKYETALNKVNSREDLNYLIEELIGETGTSHNYIINRGDQDLLNHPKQGHLGAQFKWSGNGYEVISIINVKDFKGLQNMPLLEPGNRMEIGDLIIAINGIHCSQDLPIEALLSKKGGNTVAITFKRGEEIKTIYPKTLNSMDLVNYRLWMNNNRDYVHKKSNGRLGYLHIPDMGQRGFIEFHKGYSQERGREGLIIDNRYNGGGHVSSLIISTLLNKKHGAIVFQDQIEEFPDYSNSGAMILLSNEYSGSDGDLFTYQFRKHKLGKIVGRRTWGGVVGITPRHAFIDKGLTAQPEFGIWQEDFGIAIENHGVEPDFDLESSLDSQADPQLDFAIEKLLKELPMKSIESKIKEQVEEYKKAYINS